MQKVALNEKHCRIGESHPRAKLTDAEVDLVFALREEGLSLAAIAAKLEVTKGCIWKITQGLRRGQPAARIVSVDR